MITSEGKCVFVEVGALISWCIYSYRIVMLLVPYMWASMTFLPTSHSDRSPAGAAHAPEYNNLTRLFKLFKPCYLQLEILVKLYPMSTLCYNHLLKILKGHV